MSTPAPTMRIGDLAARTGVSVHVLRVWERRYGLLTPTRSPGGYRLYGPMDEWRVREAVRLREQGMSAAQAAAAALEASRAAVPSADSGEGLPAWVGDGTPTDAGTTPDGGAPLTGPAPDGVARLQQQLLKAVGEFDGTAAQAVLDVALEHLGVEQTIAELVLPALRETGERWAGGEFTVAQEHFASNLIRTRLSALTLAWDSGTGPVAVLACPPGEHHDLGLLSFGVVLGRAGWRVRYLGADTPVDTLGSAVTLLQPDLVVLTAVRREPLDEAAQAFETLPEQAREALRRARFVVAGAGADAPVAARLGAALLQGDPVVAARRLSDRAGTRGRR
jgi:methanogenic corrinoid protein MtbC1